ncbi:unnamed protein product [Didymodactylos carnosus]|uniref:Adapter molecule Crk n=1 Tax=Didymodactylos carnosus TaxID=1234261 RepID=A0A814MH27_9BILA|nr:unnamed protein product [Didymodactylos carnosus]CAF1077898.1 unnamed protein product [Didymodactylos carnosus]CAF3663763.1 unnamed protein product [Didymodactylos carnosus]CAF3844186.1 unnamed protein product [Didymodactylos carnosus]
MNESSITVQKPDSSVSEFDPEDEDSWMFENISREEAINMLQDQVNGTFLVRQSGTIIGDLVLCVKEGSKVSHYIINCRHNYDDFKTKLTYKIGDKIFSSMPELLTFYKQRLLDTSPLIKIHPKPHVRCKYNFPGKDEEDLPFKKGEILMIVKKDEALWWTARNASSGKGLIPANYVEYVR